MEERQTDAQTERATWNVINQTFQVKRKRQGEEKDIQVLFRGKFA